MGHKIGLDCKLYYNTGGNEDPIVPGNWTELDNARDVTLNLEKGEADVTTRANAGWQGARNSPPARAQKAAPPGGCPGQAFVACPARSARRAVDSSPGRPCPA